MDLWIRSQNKKELIKINHLVLMAEEIRGVIDNGHYIMLGTYKTKERALEVLDEIQKLLMPISEYVQDTEGIIINYKNINTIIYEMPKE